MAEDTRVTGLLTAAEQVAAVADRIGRTFARELQRVQLDLERELRRLLVDAAQGRRTSVALAARGLQLRRQLREVLEAAGYDDLASASTVGGLERMAEAVERMNVAAQVARFTTRDATRIAALKELARLDLLAQGDEIATALWRSTVQGLFSQRRVNDILDDLAESLDKELAEVRTLYDTTVSIYGRQVEMLKVGDDPDATFLYAGPADLKTRPFCRDRVGKVFTRQAIEKWDNGNLPGPPFMVLGGWNCRHSLIAVSKFSDLAGMADTGERIPEVAEQFADLRRAA